MQLDVETVLTIALGPAAGALSAAIGHGIMREKLARVVQDVKDLRDEQKGLVPFAHFEAVIGPLTRTLQTLETDIKELLRVVSARSGAEKD